MTKEKPVTNELLAKVRLIALAVLETHENAPGTLANEFHGVNLANAFVELDEALCAGARYPDSWND